MQAPLAVLVNVNTSAIEAHIRDHRDDVLAAFGPLNDAQRACLVTDAWEGIEAFLEPEQEVLVARDGAEVAAHLSALPPERAARIGRAARSRVLAEHTYHHRAEQLDALLDQGVAVR